eukprot:c4719_g1_i1.p1 GENE.c4719_g1_i1~~c4719_g1_i1.p1  ORF type:complete len:207 (-),score=60.94 c4719_g1_i1:128-712(-)
MILTRGRRAFTCRSLVNSYRYYSTATQEQPKSIANFIVKDAEGKDVKIGDVMGPVTIVVNVASDCGFTNQNYKELEELYQKHHKNGLNILAFPCNQFGGQEPQCALDVKKSVTKKFGVSFPIFDKIDVNGPSAHPLFLYLQSSQPGLLFNGIKWNFTKFLCANGIPLHRYAPNVSPLSIETDILGLLQPKSSSS